MNLKNISVGGGLALMALAVIVNAGVSLITAFSTQAHAGTGAVGNAVASAAMAQGGGERKIVWYSVLEIGTGGGERLYRAWSDGTVEFRRFTTGWDMPQGSICTGVDWWNGCVSPWIVIASPQEGLAAFADLDSNGKVDAVDLSQVLSRWGDAPRNDIPPSDCPLNLINP